MKFLKGLALSLLGLLLFLSLSAFGLAFTVNSTLLNPSFVTYEVNRLNLSSLAGDVIKTQVGGLPSGLSAILADTRLEPQIKEGVDAVIPPVYDYLLGRSQNLDLPLVIENAALKPDITLLVDNPVFASLVRDFIINQYAGKIPAPLNQNLAQVLDKAFIDLKPWLKQQLKMAAQPTLDYLLGRKDSLNVVISLAPVNDSLKNSLGASYQQISGVLPTTLVINGSLFNPLIRIGIGKGIAEVEDRLTQFREYVSRFQLIYKALIAFILLLIVGIILLHREVKGATRGLGTIFLTYGAFEWAGVFIARRFALPQLPLAGMPPSLQTWVPQFVSDFMTPLETFSITLAAVGIVLLIVSFVVKPRRVEQNPSAEESSPKIA